MYVQLSARCFVLSEKIRDQKFILNAKIYFIQKEINNRDANMRFKKLESQPKEFDIKNLNTHQSIYLRINACNYVDDVLKINN